MKRNHRRPQGTARNRRRQQEVEIARATAALQQWQNRKEVTDALTELLAGR